MLCRSVRRLLSAYTDGELSPADAGGVKAHLDRCEACSREHSGLRRLVSMTSSIPMEEVPATLHEQIVMRLAYADLPGPEQVSRPTRRSPMPRTWAWAAFTVAAAAVMSGALHNRPPSDHRVRLSFPAVETASPSDAPKSTPAPTVAKSHDSAETDHTTVAAAPETILEPVRDTDSAVEGVVPETKSAAAPPMVRKLTPERGAGTMAAAPADRPLPVSVPTVGRPATELRASEPTEITPRSAMAMEGIIAMPGEPLNNAVGNLVPQDPVMPIDKDPTRMAGMAVEVETPGEEDEGLRAFRMFLQENSRTVPQPPTVRPRERGRKSL